MTASLGAALALAVLLQASPDESLNRRVDRFVAGDDTQGESIRAAGLPAMRLLFPLRSKPGVKRLMREIRQAGTSVDDQQQAQRLAKAQPSLGGEDRPFLSALVAVMGEEVRWGVHLPELDRVSRLRVRWDRDGFRLEALEELCGAATLDFAFRGGMVLIAAPEYLWPLPPAASPLAAEDEERVKTLIVRLGLDSPAEREKAERELRSYGAPIAPFLVEPATRGEPEVRMRCHRLLADLQAPPPAPPQMFLMIACRQARSWEDGPECVCEQTSPTITLLPKAPTGERFEGIQLSGDSGLLRGPRSGGRERITLKGNVAVQGPGGLLLRADEVVVDLVNQTLTCRGAAVDVTPKK
jgi:hypothetical protein